MQDAALAALCDEVQNLWMAGELPDRLRPHLEDCPSCRAFVALGAEQLKQGLEPTQPPEPASAPTLPGPEAGGRAESAPLPVVDPHVYSVSGEVTRGGQGRILRAKDLRLQRAVAIKELLDRGPELSARFVREALVTARLQHPSIVTVYEAGSWPNGEPFYAMKLVSGRPLDAVVREAKTLEARLALLPNVIAVCEAMAYAHGERIIHRDLKPANVLVGAFGETVVIDWGLAKDLAVDAPSVPAGPYRAASDGARTGVGAVMGTPGYMPPEQANGEVVDERADVYALGALLYHVLAGRPPFEGRSGAEILAAVAHGPPVPLEEREPRVPADLAAIVAKSMARAREARYPTGKEMAAELLRFQTGQLVGAHRYSLRQLLARWVRRHRAPVLVAAAAALVLAAYGAWSVRRIVQESAHATASAREAAAQRDRAIEQANRAVLAQARGELVRDPAATLRLIETLDRRGPGWDAARVIAEDARSRPRVERSVPIRKDGRLPIEKKWVVDAAHDRVFLWSWENLWIVDANTGQVGAIDAKRPIWPDHMVPCDDGGRLVGWNDTAVADYGVLELDVAARTWTEKRRSPDELARMVEACRAQAMSRPDAAEGVTSADGRWRLTSGERVIVRDTSAADWQVSLGDANVSMAAFIEGNRVVTWTAEDGTLRVWALAAPHLVGVKAEKLEASSDRRWLVEERDEGLRQVDATGVVADETAAWPVARPQQTFVLQSGAVADSGDVIALFGETVWVWRRVGGWSQLGDVGETMTRVGWTPAGTAVAWTYREIHLWGADGARRIEIPNHVVRRLVAVSPDASLAATVDTAEHTGQVLLVAVAHGTETPLEGASGGSNEDHVQFSGDGRHLLTGAGGDGFLVWDVAAVRARRVAVGDVKPYGMALSADGQRVGFGTPTGAVIVEVEKGTRHTLGTGRRVDRIVFDEETDRVLTGGDGAVLWDLRSDEGRALAAGTTTFLALGHGDAVVGNLTGLYRFDDDLPEEPCALLARLGKPCAKERE